LALVGAWRIRDEEIPRVALLTAAFFVASLVPIPLPGGTSAHLLLNGVVGILLGFRAGLAILVGLGLQMVLFRHGGYSTLGINTCIMALPAFLAAGLFACLRRLPWTRQAWFRAFLVGLCVVLCCFSLVFGVVLLLGNRPSQLANADLIWVLWVTFHPITLVITGLLALLAVWGERRLENPPEFPLGMVVGEIAVLVTVLLQSLVLVWGGTADLYRLALLAFVLHLPLAVIEGIILGFTVGFLARVKPEMLLGRAVENSPCAAP
jgi:cobalt/nickel transport system permease protein